MASRSSSAPVFTVLLGAASLVTVGLIVAVFLVPPAQGYNGIGELLLMGAAASLRWALLAILLGWCVRRGRFDWLRGSSMAGRLARVLGGHLVLGGLSVTAMLAATDDSVLRGLPPDLNGSMHVLAQLGCT